MKFDIVLRWLHMTGNLVWIGSILAVGLVIVTKSADAKVRGEIALALYQRLAAPAFVLSFLGGAVRLFSEPAFYLKQHHWMHAKLPLALGVIALHHVIGARAKKLAQGTVQDPGPTATLSLVLAALAVGAAFFAIFKIPD